MSEYEPIQIPMTVTSDGQSYGVSMGMQYNIHDGFSPVIDVEDIPNGHRVIITDAEGDHVFDVMNGTQGPQGEPGVDGKDGKDGKDGVDGRDGINGKDGKNGTDGKDGKNGTDGFSPIATINKIGKIAIISITDKNGTTSSTLNDGLNGEDGKDGLAYLTDITQTSSPTALRTWLSASFDGYKLKIGNAFQLVIPNTTEIGQPEIPNYYRLNVNSTGAYPIWFDGVGPSVGLGYPPKILNAGIYWVFFDGNTYHIYTNGVASTKYNGYTINENIFYGLAELAGVDLRNSETPVGTYPEDAQEAIKAMLGIT